MELLSHAGVKNNELPSSTEDCEKQEITDDDSPHPEAKCMGLLHLGLKGIELKANPSNQTQGDHGHHFDNESTGVRNVRDGDIIDLLIFAI